METLEKRNLKINFNTTYNRTGSSSYACRVTLPTKWIRSLGITQDDRTVEVRLCGDEIIIKKVNQ